MFSALLGRHAPLLFVVLWSTGFIGAKWGLPSAGPLTFLSIRYGLVIGLMALFLVLARQSPPRPSAQWSQWAHWGVSGLLLHGGYLAGVFIALHHQLPAGVVALIVGLQPILTALLTSSLVRSQGQGPLSATQWSGLILAFVGVVMVVSGKWAGQVSWLGSLSAFVALLFITWGTLYQKKHCHSVDWRVGSILQFSPSLLVTLPFAWGLESFAFNPTPSFLLAMLWLVLVLSVGAIGLLNFLIRHGSAVNVASLFYLVPPCTALMAWLIFDERLNTFMLIGMILCVLGVILVRRNARPTTIHTLTKHH